MLTVSSLSQTDVSARRKSIRKRQDHFKALFILTLFRKKHRRCAVHLIRVNKVQNSTETGLAIME